MENLDVCAKLGLETVGGTLLAYLGENFLNISKLAEIGGLSEAMVRRLLQAKVGDSSQTIHRLNILATWLSVNTMDARGKKEILQTLDTGCKFRSVSEH